MELKMNRQLLVSIALLSCPVKVCRRSRVMVYARLTSRSLVLASLAAVVFSAIGSDPVNAHPPDKQHQPVHQRYDVIGPLGNRLPAGHRRKYNRPSYIGGKISYWIAPSSQEAMSWHRAVHSGAYKAPKKHQYIYQQYFYPKPWQLLPVGPRPSSAAQAEREQQLQQEAENIEPGPSIIEPIPSVDEPAASPEPATNPEAPADQPAIPADRSLQPPAELEQPAENKETLGSMLIESKTAFGRVEASVPADVQPSQRSVQQEASPSGQPNSDAGTRIAQTEVINIKPKHGLSDAALIQANLPPQSTAYKPSASNLPVSAAMIDLITPSWLRKEHKVHGAETQQGSKQQLAGKKTAAEQGSTQPVRVVPTGALVAGINDQDHRGPVRAAHQAELTDSQQSSAGASVPEAGSTKALPTRPASFNFILRDDGFLPADEFQAPAK